MNVELHLLINGVDQGPLPSYQSLSLSPVFCDIGAISFKYPKAGKRYSLIDGRDELEIVPWVDGVAYPRLGGYVNQISSDDVAEAAVFDYAGQTYMRRMDEILVYPPNWPNYDPAAPSYEFTNANAGNIMRSLMNAAQARGTGADITTGTWNTTTDSKGAAWAKMITLEVKPGSTLFDVLTSLHANNMIEFEMVGHDLRIYNIDTLSTDRTVGPGKPLTFRKGRDLTDSPRKVSSRDVATVMLAAGKDDAGLYREDANATAIAKRRRIEGFISNGNVIDAGTLAAFNQATLQKSVNPLMEKTHGLAYASKKTPKPLTQFDVGDWVYSDTGDGLEKLRVKAWVLSIDDKGVAKGSVTLNDLIAEANAKLTQRINGIVGGSTITGESKAVDAVPSDVVDGMGPAAPSGLGLASAPFTDDNGVTWAQVTATWAQVTTNQDGTVLEDLAGYNVRWRYIKDGAVAPWHVVASPGNGTVVMWSPVGANASIEAQVQAYDKYGNLSNWSTPPVNITTQDDTTPPEQPSKPVMDNYLGLLRAFYDGKTQSGAAWAPDVMQIQVHTSTTNNFTPTPATWTDTLTGSGFSYIETPYGQNTYVKFVAQDRGGNLSVPSLQSNGASTQIVGADVFDGAIGTAKLADLAVVNAKIGNLAVNNAKMSDVSIAKLTAGTLNADLTVAARIATALSGKRVEMNGVGYQGWDASGNLTLSIDGASNLMMGTFKTALAGRRIEIAAAGTRGEINFYGPQGQNGKFWGFTDDVSFWSSECIAMLYPIAGKSSAWNSIQVASDEEAYISSGFIGMYCGADGTGSKGFQIRWALDRGTTSGLFNQGYARFQVDNTYTSMYDAFGNPTVQAGNSLTRFSTWTSNVFAAASGGYMQINPTTNGTQSPNLWFNGGTAGYGGYMYTLGNPAEFNFVVGSGSVWAPTRASAFNVSSDEQLKRAVKKHKGSARAKLAPMTAHTYKLKGDESDRTHLGYMAHTAPDEIRVADHGLEDVDGPSGEAINLYGLTTLGIEYIKEVDAELEALRAEFAELKELVKK